MYTSTIPDVKAVIDIRNVLKQGGYPTPHCIPLQQGHVVVSGSTYSEQFIDLVWGTDSNLLTDWVSEFTAIERPNAALEAAAAIIACGEVDGEQLTYAYFGDGIVVTNGSYIILFQAENAIR